MLTTKTTKEMLDDFYNQIQIQDRTETHITNTAQIEDNSLQLENLINEYENLISFKEKENVNESTSNEEVKNQTKILMRQMLSIFRLEMICSESKSSNHNNQSLSPVSQPNLSLTSRMIHLCINNKRVIELLQILIEKEDDHSILQLFIKLNPVEIRDYEDCLFVCAEYLISQPNKLDRIFKLLLISVQNRIEVLYPIFSLGVQKLSKSSRIDEATMLVNYMLYYRIEIYTCAINCLIENLCRVEKIEEAQSYFTGFLNYKSIYNFPNDIIEKCKFSKLLMSSGINIITYGILLKCLCKSNHMELALYHYENLKEQDLIKDEIIFNLLIDGCSKTSNLDQLKHIYYDMLLLKVTPTIVTFNTIIDAYIRAKDLNSAWQIYEDILAKGVRPDNFTYSTLFRGIRHKSQREYLKKSIQIIEREVDQVDIILINVLLDSCVSMRDDKMIIELFEKAKSSVFPNLKPDIITYNTFIKGCAQMNLFKKANEAFDYMCESSVIPNDVTFNTMIDVCARSGNMSQVWNIIEKMKNVGIKPDNFTYSTIIKGLNKNTNLNTHSETSFPAENKNEVLIPTSELHLAFKLFENVKKFSKPDEILYNCIMDACLRFDEIDKMLELYDEMLVENIRPSSITCGIVIKAYGMKGNLNKVLEIYEDMKKTGIDISSITYGCLINACIKNDNLQKAFELYKELGEDNIEMNTVLYTTLIKAYSKTKDLNKVLEIFNKMKRDKINTPNNITFNSVIDCCVKCNEEKLAEKILEDMQKSGIIPDIITFSTIIKGCLKKGELSRAIDYLNSMQKFEIIPDQVLLNTLLDGCEKMSQFSKAVEIFNYVRSFGVDPSMMSYSIMMKVYGKLNDFESSTNLMEEVKKKNKNFSLIIFTCYIKTCFSVGNLDAALTTYNELKEYKLIPDSITISTMLKGLLGNSESKSYDILNIIMESLNMNIILNEKIYIDAVKRISNDNCLFEELDRVVNMLKELNIRVDKYSNQKGEGNINYLINNYKHKSNHLNNTNNHFKSIVLMNNLVSSTTPVDNKEKLVISGYQKERINKYSGSGLKYSSNVNTGNNYNHFPKNSQQNFSIFKDEIKTNIEVGDHEQRPRFINSKKESVDLARPEQTVNYSNSYKQVVPFKSQGVKDNVKRTKFNRF